ncbi:MAG: hypothetical protein POELPBGB_03854 [Bacteroidia bacterium]|nr:hypothetical protein [Bacteroidia bacterium]
MKKLLHLSIFILVITTFYGCPVGIDYPLGVTGTEKINKDLLGTWVSDSPEAEVLKVKFEKNDDNSYKVTVLERGEMYALETDNLTGWVTELEGKTFLFFKPENEEKYYHYMIKEIGNGTMVTCDVSLLDGGVDAVTSTEALRKQVASSMKSPEYGAESISWTKE